MNVADPSSKGKSIISQKLASELRNIACMFNDWRRGLLDRNKLMYPSHADCEPCMALSEETLQEYMIYRGDGGSHTGYAEWL
jgi:hypothetical protein